MSKKDQRIMSKKILGLLRYCEENFEKGNLEYALRCAVSICVSNPDAPEPYAHVAAYRMLLAAANNRITATGEPDWYAVLGIKRGLPPKSIDMRCYEILELLNEETRTSKAVLGAYDLLRRGVVELKKEARTRDQYEHQRFGFSLC